MRFQTIDQAIEWFDSHNYTNDAIDAMFADTEDDNDGVPGPDYFDYDDGTYAWDQE